jgi:DNA ligase (NAD+)
MQNCKAKWYDELPADGIVLTSDKFRRDGNNIEYYAVAYKFPTDSKQTKVVDVLWELTKTRYLMPRIKVQPVELAGSTVQYCTGINAQYIKESGIGIGAQVMITKANEIIPQITDVLMGVGYSLPTHCPVCGEPLAWNGVHLQCKNPNCYNASIQDVLVWFNKLAPTDGLGDTLICKFLDVIANLLKLYLIHIQAQFLQSGIKPMSTHMLTYNKPAGTPNKLRSHRFISCRVFDDSIRMNS